nr:uncharacterized protein LOC127331766 [Lolium perenne]
MVPAKIHLRQPQWQPGRSSTEHQEAIVKSPHPSSEVDGDGVQDSTISIKMLAVRRRPPDILTSPTYLICGRCGLSVSIYRKLLSLKKLIQALTPSMESLSSSSLSLSYDVLLHTYWC